MAWTRRELIKAATTGGVGSTILPLSALLAETAQANEHTTPAEDSLSVLLAESVVPRERVLLDQNWKFAFGHVSDPARDFSFGKTAGTGVYAKSGEAGGPTGVRFDDSQWETIQLPHDWAVQLPFIVESPFIGHGGKPVGREFPETSIGWYRHELNITPEDKASRIALEFDGIFRDAAVFVNGHYVAQNMSG